MANQRYVWLGEIMILGYDIVVIADNESKCRELLLAEHRKSHEKNGCAD